MVFECNTICDRFFKQIAMLSYNTRRQYNDIYNKRVVKSVSATKGIDKKDYLQCPRCVLYIKKSLAFTSINSGHSMCPCCGTFLRRRIKRQNSDTRSVKRID